MSPLGNMEMVVLNFAVRLPCARRGLLPVLLVVGLTAACSETESKRPAPSSTPATVPVLSEHRFKSTAAGSSLPFGSDCSVGGTSDCASGLCVHVGAWRDAGYVCTERCGPESPCPEGWRCGQVHPSDPTASLCLPVTVAR